jgi:[amino group carrier protein]-lysine/ornithine hydrolase
MNDAQADALLRGLVERYSPSTHEAGAVRYLVEQMADRGFEATVDGAGNAVGILGEGDRTLMLLGHIDTVPGELEVRQEDTVLSGRGTVDAKGPLATFVAATARAGAPPGGRVVVVGAVEEEAATSKGARHLLSRYRPNGVVIGEPSRWNRLTVGYKGRLLVDYTLERDMGHRAGPAAGVCEEAVAFWQDVQVHVRDYNGGRDRVFDQLTPSLRTMHAESDGRTETATLTLGFRLPMGLDIDAFQAALVDLAGDARLHFRGREPAYHATKNNRLVRAFIKAAAEEGTRIYFKVKSGTSDMNVVGPVWQCPIAAYGPGDSSLDHTPDEHIDLREYHRAIALLARVVAEF